MTRISTMFAMTAIGFGVLLLPTTTAATTTCGRTGTGVPNGPQALVFFIGGIPDAPTGHIVVSVDATGNLTADGTVHMQDGQSTRVRVPDKGFGFVEMSCAVDDNGFLEVTALQLVVHDVRSGESLPFTLVPEDGGLREDEERVLLMIGSATSVQTASVLFAPSF